jgi:predicted Rossmann-fold nucleotide-binding protein
MCAPTVAAKNEHEDGRRLARDPRTGVQIRIGVMGSAGGGVEPRVAEDCRRLGRVIAAHGCCLPTGACPGLPHDAVLGAKEGGGHVIGVSPATTLKEHVELYQSPYREYDVLILAGMGLMGRELINIHAATSS